MYKKMDNKEKILKIIFEEPNKEFHIRLLARLTKMHPNTVITITDELAKENTIFKNSDKERRLTIIKANAQNEFYKLKKLCYNIEKIRRSGLIDYINKELAYPTIILFGSYAKAENHKKSDIDLFIITEQKKPINLKRYEEELSAEIQLFIYTKNEFIDLKKTNPELTNNVINGFKMEGFLEVL